MKKINVLTLCGLSVLAFSACQTTNQQEAAAPTLGLHPDSFGVAKVDGKDIKLYTLKNKKGAVAQFTNLGAKMVTLYMPDRNGKFDDVVLGYATAAEYAKCDNAKGEGEPFFGATIGRYGNRIANGKFAIDGVEYNLNVNEMTNCLHGGNRGFYSQVWEVEQQGDSAIVFSRVSPDGEMGFPGNLDTKVCYQLTDTNSIVITYLATTDKPTVVNLTNHSFFNLNGEADTTVNDEEIRIAADQFSPVNDVLCPTGEMASVDGTPFDFRTSRPIADSLDSKHPQMILGNGYDHNFVLSDCIGPNGLRFAAEVRDPQSGRIMTVLTNEPGLQFYEGNFLNSTQMGKCGHKYPHRSALCLETQHFPNTPNFEDKGFPSCRLNPGEQYKSVCVYGFSVDK